MFNLKDINIKDVSALEYHFENEDLNVEFINPIEIEILDDNSHIVTDNDGCIFIIQPKWVYISIVKRIIRDSNPI